MLRVGHSQGRLRGRLRGRRRGWECGVGCDSARGRRDGVGRCLETPSAGRCVLRAARAEIGQGPGAARGEVPLVLRFFSPTSLPSYFPSLLRHSLLCPFSSSLLTLPSLLHPSLLGFLPFPFPSSCSFFLFSHSLAPSSSRPPDTRMLGRSFLRLPLAASAGPSRLWARYLPSSEPPFPFHSPRAGPGARAA